MRPELRSEMARFTSNWRHNFERCISNPRTATERELLLSATCRSTSLVAASHCATWRNNIGRNKTRSLKQQSQHRTPVFLPLAPLCSETDTASLHICKRYFQLHSRLSILSDTMTPGLPLCYFQGVTSIYSIQQRLSITNGDSNSPRYSG